MAEFDFDVIVDTTPGVGAEGVGDPSTRLNVGSDNDSAEDIFRKHFNPGIKAYEPGWDALIKGISAGDEINFENGRLAIDQLWIHSASGIYLDRRAADVGVVRPDSVGISDEVFRRLTIKTTTKKLVTQALLEAMEVFYGTDSTRANLTCIDEPYALTEGWELLLRIDGGSTITVPFVEDDFEDIEEASAIEVAAVITRWLQSNDSEAYALEITNTTTGLNAVRIYSSALGLGSSVQVVGGQAQNVLQFPTLLDNSSIGDEWEITLPSPGVVRFTIVGSPSPDLNLVFAGDYVNIFDGAIGSANQGSFPIEAVDVRYENAGADLTQYFEILLDTGDAESAIMVADDGIVFFRPTRTTINDNGSRAVIVCQDSPGEVNVQLPATTIAVSRTAKTGAYANLNEAVEITSLLRRPLGGVDLVTDSAHGLTVGGQVFIDGIVSDGTLAAVNAGSGTTTTGTVDASLTTDLATIAGPAAGSAAGGKKSLLLTTGDVFVCGGDAAGTEVLSSQRLRINTPVELADTSIQYTYTWVATADMPVATSQHAIASITVQNGQAGNVLVSGGTSFAAVFSTSYIYNVTGNTWSASMAMTNARMQHAMVELDDGQILALGGFEDLISTATDTAELFTTQANAPGGSWAATGSMRVARALTQAIKLADGTVLVMGGDNGTGAIASCELFDPDTGTFSEASPMGYSRADHRAVLLPNDRIFVWGGYGRVASHTGAADADLSTAEIYDGGTGRWYPVIGNPNRTPVTPLQPDEIAYLALKDQIVVMGRGLERIDFYDVSIGQWKASVAALNDAVDPVDFVSLVALEDYPVVVVAGGITEPAAAVLGARLYVSTGDRTGSGGVNGVMLQVTAVDSATEFSVATPDFGLYLGDAASEATMTRVEQEPAAVAIPGPYIYSPDHGFAITDILTVTTEALAQGTKYKHIGVTAGDAADFEDEEGWLVFGFGTALELGPVKYVGRKDNDTLILSYDTVFPADLPIGTSVTLLDGKGPYVPEDPADAGSLYITDSSSGRIEASSTLDDIVAGGITLIKTVVYPGDIGLGAAGFPVSGQKLSDKVEVWSGNDIDGEMLAGRGSE